MKRVYFFLAGGVCAIALIVVQSLWHLPLVQAASGCDKSYPDVCIPSPPPDLDCKDISHRNFRVLPPDPHRFDHDKDGIGCERKR